METENDMIVETLLGLSGASDEHMEEVLSAIPFFTEWNMLSLWDGLPVKSRLPPEVAKRIFYYYHVSDIGEADQTEDGEQPVRVTIRVDAGVKRNLQRQAKELDMSVSEYIALLVMQPYEDENGETD